MQAVDLENARRYLQQQAKNKIDACEKQVAAARQEVKQLTDGLAALQAANTQLAADHQRDREHMAALRAVAAASEEQRVETVCALAARDGQMADMQQRHQEEHQLMLDLDQEVGRLRQELARALAGEARQRAANEHLQGEAAPLREEAGRLAEENDRLESEVRRLEAQLSKKEAENSATIAATIAALMAAAVALAF